jgi:hypothetical protein
MNFENAKIKVKEIWDKIIADDPEVEEETEEENFLNTHMGMQMILLRFIIGFVGATVILQAIMPEMLTKAIFTIPDGKITFMSLLPIGVISIAMYVSCDMLGKQIIEWTMKIGNDIKNRVTIPKMLGNMMVPIVIGCYLIYKMYYPNIIALITGVR